MQWWTPALPPKNSLHPASHAKFPFLFTGKPCNAISQLLHVNTVRVPQNSSHNVLFFLPEFISRLWHKLKSRCSQRYLYIIFIFEEVSVERWQHWAIPLPISHPPSSAQSKRVVVSGLLLLVWKTNNKCSGCSVSVSAFFFFLHTHTYKHESTNCHERMHAHSGTPSINTQRPAAYQIGTAGINTLKKKNPTHGRLRGCNQILSTTKTIVERIWWTDGNFRQWNATLPGVSQTSGSRVL